MKISEYVSIDLHHCCYDAAIPIACQATRDAQVCEYIFQCVEHWIVQKMEPVTVLISQGDACNQDVSTKGLLAVQVIYAVD